MDINEYKIIYNEDNIKTKQISTDNSISNNLIGNLASTLETNNNYAIYDKIMIKWVV